MLKRRDSSGCNGVFGMKRFEDYIASLRRSRNLTQGELAGKLGVSHQAVSKRERGETIPGISKIETLLIYWVLP